MRTYVHTYIQVVHAYMHTYIHTHIYTYTHTYIHTYIHTYRHIHTYIHTYNMHSRDRRSQSSYGNLHMATTYTPVYAYVGVHEYIGYIHV